MIGEDRHRRATRARSRPIHATVLVGSVAIACGGLPGAGDAPLAEAGALREASCAWLAADRPESSCRTEPAWSYSSVEDGEGGVFHVGAEWTFLDGTMWLRHVDERGHGTWMDLGEGRFADLAFHDGVLWVASGGGARAKGRILRVDTRRCALAEHAAPPCAQPALAAGAEGLWVGCGLEPGRLPDAVAPVRLVDPERLRPLAQAATVPGSVVAMQALDAGVYVGTTHYGQNGWETHISRIDAAEPSTPAWRWRTDLRLRAFRVAGDEVVVLAEYPDTGELFISVHELATGRILGRSAGYRQSTWPRSYEIGIRDGEIVTSHPDLRFGGTLAGGWRWRYAEPWP